MAIPEYETFPESDWSDVPDEYLFLASAADRYVTRPMDVERIVDLLDSLTPEEIQRLSTLSHAASSEEFLDGFNRWYGSLRKRSIAAMKLYILLDVLDPSPPDSPFHVSGT